MKKNTISIFILLSCFILSNTGTNAQIFYGMANQGGSHGKGTLFECTASGTLTVLVNFDSSTNGAYPFGNLIQATNGQLYGMTSSGGSSGKGTLFKCSLSGALTTLVNFTGANGANPQGSIVQASDGNLYGMTTMGGTSDSGTIFKCTLSGTLTTLMSFTRTKGTLPYGNLMQANDGNLYGMTSMGGDSGAGTLFSYAIGTNTFTRLNSFAALRYGSFPMGSLIQAFDGNLYGLTIRGGTQYGGVIFKSTLSGSITRLYSFDITGIFDAGVPYGKLVQANDTTLFGLSSSGPDFTFGTLFSFNIAGNAEAINPMGGCTFNAAQPRGSLIQASDDSLYGMSTYGEPYCYGIILKSNLSRAFSTVAVFNDTNGAYPYGDLVEVNPTEGVPSFTLTNADISIFPVPANNTIRVTIDRDNFSMHDVTVYDVSGRKLMNEKLPSSSREISLNISSLSDGVYILTINGDNGIATGRFVVQH